MERPDPKQGLWENVSALMRKHYGSENLTRLARETKCGPGTASRVKAMHTSVGTDVLDKISERFDLAPWQLLVPGLDPNNPPTLRPITEQERALYERLISVAASITALKK